MADDKIEVQNFTSPSHIQRVDRTKYMAMRAALWAVLPDQPPGLAVAKAKDALLPHLPQDLFPEGQTAGWWLKCVQLDLEAKGALRRAEKPPVQLYRAGPLPE